ncbi:MULTISPECIES: DUF1902 domain-containing protein [Erwiniaceae]|uniref:DUF1902 domain-containing protein n=1 Tax=Pantoea coffeiphila TaxID=1465635 RepID=A0A2S9I6U4_9GAMM|nr:MULTISPECIES: DUF1902 domain-containing protein [Erwiniaceae]MBK0000047.1 DUF1902 domain-containing protein [Erwinia sp. S38]PRD13512.1 hypothetical protein CQW29_21060 [Pantoea coffeiphila]
MKIASIIKFPKSFNVNVCHDADEGVWVAECEELGLVTEAPTYEELTQRVWDIAPDLYRMNGLGENPEHLRLSFNHQQSYSERIAL